MSLASLFDAARHRRWLLTLADLAALGMAEDAIRHAVRAGWLHRVHRGVYAVGRPELSVEARWLAATLAVDRSLLGVFSGASSFGLVPATAGPVHLVVEGTGGRTRRSGIVVHRTTVPPTATWRSGIPVTTLGRTLRDLARPLSDTALARAVRQAEVLHRIDLVRLHRELSAAPRNAVPERRLLHVVERYVPGQVNVGFEEALLEVCVRARLPLPTTQHHAGRWRIDFAWPDLLLAVEADDRFSHDTRAAFRDDRVKDRGLRALGWDVMRFTYEEVTREGPAVGRELRAAIARRRRETGA